MAHLSTSAGINLLNGALSKKKKQGKITVTRVKSVKDPITGEIIGHGPNELYIQEQRNYKRHPLTAGEQAQRQRWREACKEASAIIHDRAHPRYMELYRRWRAQANTGDSKVCKQFPNFVRAVLARESRP